jgi:hypothetical protein
MTDELGSWVCIYDALDSLWTVGVDDEPRVDAAVSRYLDSGGTTDTLLDLTTIENETLRIRASLVVAWFVSSPETRRRSVEVESMQKSEHAANRQATGQWTDDE